MHKSKIKYVGVFVVLAVFGVLFIPKIWERIAAGNTVDQTRMSQDGANAPLSYIYLNGEPRRVPAFTFLNQDSLVITEKDYLGKVFVAEFFFTTCPTICPVMTTNLTLLQQDFQNHSDFGIASFTINPRFDTPVVLKQYAEKYNITHLDWHLLTGNQDSIYNLANSGFNIFASEAVDVEGGFEHSGLFALIDKKGYLRSRLDEFGNPIVYYRGYIPEDRQTDIQGETEQISLLKEDIQKLLSEK